MSTELEYTATMAGDQALMEALEAMTKLESENEGLKTDVTDLKAENRELKSENERLKEGCTDQQVKELIRVNHQWDIEYRQQEDAFHKYRIDSQRAQHENQGYIAKLKEEKDYQAHEIATLKRELSRGSHADAQHEITALRREIAHLKQKIQMLEQQGGRRSDEGRRIRQLEEELSLTKQQVTAYKEDFEAERRDRERLVEEKQSVALRYDPEITSLKLQLDRCRNELQHYTTEATRLAQQLRIKSQFEEDQYKKHLESRGYVSCGSNGTLPPLDPFVEHDPPSMHPPNPKIYEPPQNRAQTNSPKPVPRTNAPLRSENAPQRRISAPQRNLLLARSSDTEDSISAPASFGNEYAPAPTVQRNMTHNPTHFRRQSPPIIMHGYLSRSSNDTFSPSDLGIHVDAHRMRNRYEENQYKKHLGSRGYLPRGSSNGMSVTRPNEDDLSMHPPPPKSRRTLDHTVVTQDVFGNVRTSASHSVYTEHTPAHSGIGYGTTKFRQPIPQNSPPRNEYRYPKPLTPLTPPNHFSFGNQSFYNAESPTRSLHEPLYRQDCVPSVRAVPVHYAEPSRQEKPPNRYPSVMYQSSYEEQPTQNSSLVNSDGSMHLDGTSELSPQWFYGDFHGAQAYGTISTSPSSPFVTPSPKPLTADQFGLNPLFVGEELISNYSRALNGKLGPTVVKELNLGTLIEALRPLPFSRSNHDHLARALGVSEYRLSEIEANNPHDTAQVRTEILKELLRTSEEPTWQIVGRAVLCTGDKLLAGKLMAYKMPEEASSTPR